MINKRNIVHNNESGQAVTEYILLLLVIAGAYMSIAAFITNSGLANQLTSPITTTFAHAYQYGDPQTLGFENGGPKLHPRLGVGRMFINPSGQ